MVMTATELVVWGATLHLVVDWLLQNDWMAEHKSSLRHPAGYVHAGLHGVAMLLIFPVWAAVALGIAHLLIDTRRPLQWWSRLVTQPTEGPMAVSVQLWRDQTLHLVTIALAALAVG
jgi:hypothetical protein